MLQFLKRREDIAGEPLQADEIFKLVSRIKYPRQPDAQMAEGAGHRAVISAGIGEKEKGPKAIDLIKNRQNITESLRALAEKYSLKEITLATDDGLVFASSSGHDVQADAVKFSQIAKRQSAPDEAGVILFELYHKEAHLIGIIRSENELPHNWRKEIREDTKGILQWWL